MYYYLILFMRAFAFLYSAVPFFGMQNLPLPRLSMRMARIHLPLPLPLCCLPILNFVFESERFFFRFPVSFFIPVGKYVKDFIILCYVIEKVYYVFTFVPLMLELVDILRYLFWECRSFGYFCLIL